MKKINIQGRIMSIFLLILFVAAGFMQLNARETQKTSTKDPAKADYITFYFQGPSWMDNDPHDPEVWGPFTGPTWTKHTFTAIPGSNWWSVEVEVTDATAEITYQVRFCELGVTKYQKATGNFGSDPSFTTTTNRIWVDASDDGAYSWSGNNFYLSADKITETNPTPPSQLIISNVNPAEPIEGYIFALTAKAQDSEGKPSSVTSDTEITISKLSGSGSLTGTLASTLTTGQDSIVFSDLTLSAADNYELQAAATSGMSLTSATTTFTVSNTATITVDPASLSGFSYETGSGPSAVQSFDVSGAYLTNDIEIALPSNYELALSDAPFTAETSAINLTPTSGTVSATPIYVRLKAGLSINTYTETISITSTDATDKSVDLNGKVAEIVTFYFRGPLWMDNDPHDPQVWGPFMNSTWEGYTMTPVAGTDWWTADVYVTDATAEITYQIRFAESGTTKYMKASGNFGADATFTTSTGDIYIDGSDDGSYAWQNNDFYLSADKITETDPDIPAQLNIALVSPAEPAEGDTFSLTIEVQNDLGNVVPIDADTEITISKISGSGILSGTYAKSISAGSESIIFDDLALSDADTYELQAATTSGTMLTSANTTVTVITANTPSITVTPTALSGFSYEEGSGPSTIQSFEVSGENLTNDITIPLPANYELSLTNDPFMTETSDIYISPDAETVSATPIYVRLKAGLSINTYTETISITSTGATEKNVELNGEVTPMPEAITFYFRAPSFMDNDPHDPEVWGPFTSDAWTSATLTYDSESEWWTANVDVTDASAEITYQIRFAESGTTKYMKASGDFGADATFTTSTGDIYIDGSDDASYAWQGDNFYLPAEKITETDPYAPAQLAITSISPTEPTEGELFSLTVEVQNDQGNVVPIDADTEITISKISGTGNLSGTYTKTISAGSESIIFDDLALSDADTYELQAATTSGTMLTSANTTVTVITANTPSVTVTPTALSGFSYEEGSGPSAIQSFEVSGTNLTDNIVISLPANYELSLTESPFTAETSAVNLAPTSGTVAATSVYVRLKTGLAVNTYTETISITSTDAAEKSVDLNGEVTPMPETITFYFRGPSFMDNDPHDPEVWGPFTSDAWTSATLTYDSETEWWTANVDVTDASAEITYQIRFAESGTTKYMKASGDFGADATFTTSTGDIYIDGSDDASYAWQGDNFYLPAEKITETNPYIPVQLAITSVNPAEPIENETFTTTLEIQNSQGNVVPIDADTEITISKISGPGTLSGTLTKTIVVGSENIAFNDLMLSAAGTYELQAATTSGTILTNASTTLNVITATTPSITVTPTALNGFTYEEESGPSGVQSFDVSGENLTADVSIALPANFELSLTESPFTAETSAIALTPTNGTLDATTIYVRLKSALAVNTYNETVTISSNGATDKTVTLSGEVTEIMEPNYGIRDDDGANLPTFTFLHTNIDTEATMQGADFDASDLGSVDEFTISGASIKTWKSGDGDVTGAQFNYKIWAEGDTEPADYTVHTVNWTSDDGDGNQTWADFGDAIDVVDGLDEDDYQIKILFSISGTGVPGMTEVGPFQAEFTYDTTTSIYDNSNLANTRIYPNPANTVLMVELPETGETQQIIIRNIQGQVITTQPAVSKTVRMDVSAFENGIYLLEIRNTNNTITRKIIIE